MDESFGVSAVAALAGVTVRTLHHYDEIGLLEPTSRTASGYRRYTAADLARLQHIMFYRELGLGLDEIAFAMAAARQNRIGLLEEQRRLLEVERSRLDRLVAALGSAIDAEKTGVNMSPDEMFEVFGDFNPAEHETEAAQRWPNQYEASRQRTSRYGKEQWQQATAEGEAVAAKLAGLLAAGEPAGSAAAMGAAEEHRLSIDRWYYPCSLGQHVGLAEMYLSDARFEQFWEDRAEGLAQFVHDAIQANAARADGSS